MAATGDIVPSAMANGRVARRFTSEISKLLISPDDDRVFEYHGAARRWRERALPMEGPSKVAAGNHRGTRRRAPFLPRARLEPAISRTRPLLRLAEARA